MNFLLIDPYWNSGYEPPNIGLAYLCAYIIEYGFDIEVIDFISHNALFSNSIKDFNNIEKKFFQKIIVSSQKAHIIGVTCTYGNYPRAIKAIEYAKKVNPEALILLGGPFISYLSKWDKARLQPFRDSPYLDMMVIGEAEITVIEIMKRFQKEESLNNIKGTIFKDNYGNIHENETRAFCENLNEIQHPDWSILLKSDYPRFLPLLASRGCPYHCNFCFERELWRKMYRLRPALDVIQEIESNIINHNLHYYSIEDSSLLAHPEIEKICREIIQRKLPITWWALARVDEICHNPSLISLMAEAGCVSLILGLESPNENSLSRESKQIAVDQQKQALQILKSTGLHIQTCFILGFPYNPLLNDKLTIEYALELGIDSIRWHFYQPHYSNLPSNIHVHNLNNPDFFKFSNVNVPDHLLAEELKKGYLYQLTDEHALIRIIPFSQAFKQMDYILYDNIPLSQIYANFKSLLETHFYTFDEQEYYSLLHQPQGIF